MASRGLKTRPKIPEKDTRLNRREKQVLALLGEGKSSKDIANVLNITVATVASYRTQLRHKLNLHSTAELVRYALLNFLKQDQ